MSPESAVNQITEYQLPATELKSIWWLHALEEYLDRDKVVTDGVMQEVDKLLLENRISGCWFMISDGSSTEDVPHYGHLASVGQPGTNIEVDYPTITWLTITYSQQAKNSEGNLIGDQEDGNINVILRLPSNITVETSQLLGRRILEAYQRNIGQVYSDDFEVSYSPEGAKLLEI